MSELLIDSGPSTWGSSYYGTFARCKQHFSLRYRLVPMAREGVVGPNGEQIQDYEADKLVPAEALTMGSMVHTGMAHILARQGAVQAAEGALPAGAVIIGTEVDGKAVDIEVADPDMLLPPEEAVVCWTQVHGRGGDLVSSVLAILASYRKAHPEPPGLVAGVECEMLGAIGWKIADTGERGPWGLWLTDGQPAEDGWYGSVDGRWIEPDLLNAPGHRLHGQPILVTRRADAIIFDPWRGLRATILDHKTSSNPSPGSAAIAFRADMGFGLFHLMGQQAFAPEARWRGGDGFAGNYVQLLGKREPYTVSRIKVPATPNRNAMLPRRIYDIAHEIAALDLETARGARTFFEWGGAESETVCYGRYGACGGYDFCYT